jgi:dTDP-4-dehydrorhamnose reductase
LTIAGPLVLGAAGQLGAELVSLLGPSSGVTHGEVSITDAAAVDALIARRRPSVVFNCAAYNAVDRAESEPGRAIQVNRDGAANVAIACARHGARVVHFSTNFVFDGRLGRPYIESDRPAPLGVYAKSKLQGEERVQEAAPRALVIRTAAVFGGPRSFPARILDQARAGAVLRVVSDQSVNPTYAKDLAAAALQLVEQEVEGLVHAVAAGCCGWDELARATLAEAGLAPDVEAVGTDAFPGARRPANGCLLSSRIEPLRHWVEALHEWAAGVRTP